MAAAVSLRGGALAKTVHVVRRACCSSAPAGVGQPMLCLLRPHCAANRHRNLPPAAQGAHLQSHDHPAVLLACTEQDGPDQVLAALRERLGAAAAEAAVLSADVDSVQDVGALRGMLAQAQAALRRRQP